MNKVFGHSTIKKTKSIKKQKKARKSTPCRSIGTVVH